MKDTQKGLSELQSKLDHHKDAWNSKSGFKTAGNAGTQPGIVDTKNKR